MTVFTQSANVFPLNSEYLKLTMLRAMRISSTISGTWCVLVNDLRSSGIYDIYTVCRIIEVTNITESMLHLIDKMSK